MVNGDEETSSDEKTSSDEETEEIERQDVLKRSETDPNPVDVANVYPLKKNMFYLFFSVIFI